MYRTSWGRVILLLSPCLLAACAPEPAAPDVIDVLLIPADGGTEDGTLADYQPLFGAVGQSTGMTFRLQVAQSYGAVVEALCNGRADVAFVGPVTYLQARQRGCAELLAVAVKGGRSTYYAGIFVRENSPIRQLADLPGHSLALGDLNSTSSFVVPMAMLVEGGLDPARDLAAIRMTGTHSGNLAALVGGHVDAAAMSFESYQKALRSGFPGARQVRVIARSEPIPFPPLVMNTRLPAARKLALRQALAGIARAPGVEPQMIRGYGGGQVDGYDASFPAARFDGIARKMALLDGERTAAVLAKAAQR
ncbi:MAG: phosphate/phosphite/phosphonate ABC transporter substrate-binding protein [Croceibacterium sp.]